MKTWIVCLVLVACVMLVGYIEDPCATEGLMKGCMD